MTNPDGQEGVAPASFEIADPIRVLLLGDNGSESQQVKAALQNAGMLVTDGGLYYQWSPSSTSDLDGIDVVFWLEGAAWGSDPSDAADRILEAWIKNGGALVRTEWSAYDIYYSTGPTRLHALMPVTSVAGATRSSPRTPGS